MWTWIHVAHKWVHVYVVLLGTIEYLSEVKEKVENSPLVEVRILISCKGNWRTTRFPRITRFYHKSFIDVSLSIASIFNWDFRERWIACHVTEWSQALSSGDPMWHNGSHTVWNRYTFEGEFIDDQFIQLLDVKDKNSRNSLSLS